MAATLALAAPAAAQADWGAIKINFRTGQAGVGFGEPSRTAAQNEAEKDCPGKCRRGLIVRNKCGAVGFNGRRFVAGFGSSKREAIKKARQKARKGGGQGKLVAFVCSG